MSCSLRIHFVATMSSRSTYRGGRNQWRRSFSERPYNNGGRGHFVSGDAHFQSVQDTNLGLRQGIFSDQTPHPHLRQPPPHPQFRQPPPYNRNPQFRPPSPSHPHLRQPPPHPQFGQPPPHPQFRHPPPYNRNPQFRPPSPPFVQNQAVRPRPPKPLDYRNWEHAKTVTSPDSDRFLVLSYNILADYLAISHRSKLYFHIPRHILDWQWRKKSILFELGLWSADIMCFQEVDRFQDLEEELKVRGYSGIWKMRTGNAIDGCAIFWRTSRFKLLFEESIEFSKLGLRDNVAQICVLELLSQNHAENTAALPTSSAPHKKVVVCNIHVLYNPRRGEIKLGQVRTLLNRAHAVSKLWDDAPVVLCGDFNCTPKSPLFNFISEQKLDLCEVDRDKVSGQASAEIRAPKPYNPNPRAQTADGSIQTPSVVGGGSDVIQPSDPLSEMQKHNKDGNAEIFPSVNKLSPSQSTETALGGSDKETKQTLGDGCNGDMGSTFFIPIDSLKESSSCLQSEGSSTNQGQINKSDLTDMGQGETANATYSNHRSTSEQTESNVNEENEMTNSDDSTRPLVSNDQPTSMAGCNPRMIPDPNSEISSTELFCPTCSGADDKEDNYSTTYQNEVASASLSNQDEATVAGESIDEDEQSFLSALHNTEGAFPPDMNQFVRSNLDASPKELGDENLDGFSPSLDSEAVDVEKNAYDPSSWTPMELATATGNGDCTFLEHPLQLRSTYAEVEDCSGTRDSNGEPLVTSYNRCFLGTVDYIWHSEGLQTVRVLAPISKHAMQWTPGFPTKKWGSDHIALASEVAFSKP